MREGRSPCFCSAQGESEVFTKEPRGLGAKCPVQGHGAKSAARSHLALVTRPGPTSGATGNVPGDLKETLHLRPRPWGRGLDSRPPGKARRQVPGFPS